MIGAGDIASCTSTGDEETAKIINANPNAIVFALGDNSQSNGLEQTYLDCYEPAWGAFKDRTYPTMGNHDLQGAGDQPYYYKYFPNAGEMNKGFYSYNVGAWHVIVLNSMIPDWGNSEQAQWLISDLAATPAQCILAYWHNPMFHSGAGPITGRMKQSFRALYARGASILMSGDAHHYERFAPMSVDREIEPGRGIRQFIVGTGGASHTRLAAKWKATEARDNTTYGVLKLTLRPGSYAWEFIPIEGKTFTDSGEAPCSSNVVASEPTAEPTAVP